MQKMAQRARMWNIIIFSIFAALALAALIGFGIFKYQHTFSAQRWKSLPDERTKMVGDFLEKHNIVGKSKEEIVSLLGKDYSYANTNTSFKLRKKNFDHKNTILYFLGVDFMDGRWLIISFENDIVSSYFIDIT